MITDAHASHALDGAGPEPPICAILLGGFGVAPPPDVLHEAPSFEQGFGQLYDNPALLWRTHEAFLRTTAATWGWVPAFLGPDGQPRFWGEHAAAGYVDRRG